MFQRPSPRPYNARRCVCSNPLLLPATLANLSMIAPTREGCWNAMGPGCTPQPLASSDPHHSSSFPSDESPPLPFPAGGCRARRHPLSSDQVGRRSVGRAERPSSGCALGYPLPKEPKTSACPDSISRKGHNVRPDRRMGSGRRTRRSVLCKLLWRERPLDFLGHITGRVISSYS